MLSLHDLPVDVLLIIANFSDGVDLKALASVNSLFRARLAARVFRTVKLRNEVECARALRGIAEKYGQHVYGLTFTECVDTRAENFSARRRRREEPGNEYWLESPEARYGPTRESLLNATMSNILEGHLFPQAREVAIRFECTFTSAWSCPDVDEDCIQKQRCSWEFYALESDEVLRDEEPRWRWRALMSELWLTLAKNPHVRHLRIDPLVGIRTTAFSEQELKAMLSRLESVHIVTRDDTGAGNADTLLQMDEMFFKHMSSLRTLKIEYPDLVCLSTSLQAAAAFKPSSMPMLRHLELRKAFVGRAFIEFVRHHTHTIRTLVLDGCICSPNDDYHQLPRRSESKSVKWAAIFKALREDCLVLSSVTILPRDGFDHPPLELANPYSCSLNCENRHGPGNNTAPASIEIIRRKLRDDPLLWGFEYFELCNDRGLLVPAGHDLGAKEFERGDDQREFDLLRDVLRERCAVLR